MSDTGLHKLLEAPRRVECSPAPPSVSRWVAANAEALAARGAVACVRQGERIHVLVHWPDDGPTDHELIEATTNALTHGVSVQRNTDVGVIVTLFIRLGGRPGALGYRLDADPAESDQAVIARARKTVLRRMDDAMPPPSSPATTTVSPKAAAPPGEPGPAQESAPQESAAEALAARQGAALDVIAAILDHDDLAQSSRALVDALATRFACARVSLGTRRLSKVKLSAVSGTADFDARNSVMTAIARAMRETVELGRAVALPPPVNNPQIPSAHRALHDHVKSPAVLSMPLVDNGKVVGALLFERDRAFSDEDIDQITQLIILSAPVFSLKRRDASGPLDRAFWSTGRVLGRWFGTDFLLAKTLAAALLVFAIWSSQYQQTLSIPANAAIEASTRRAVVAGANSFISQVEKRAGDVVYQGDVLARLDVEDLQLERLKWASERDKLVKEQRATLAQRDRTRVRVLSAQRAQAQAQLDFLDAQIARAVLRAPIDGVVVAGDLSEALGSPVERGQLLFEVASLRDYRLVLTVDESEIGDIAEGYRGRLKLRSLPHESMEFIVTRITPVSQPGEGANQFRLEANLEQPPEALRPGMEGIARIDAGERSIGANWTRGFVRWARLQLWRLGVL
ncbi:MAG: efflux RND transporter periplasmic adaptor subunit [Gammaproteobacteria bacterium]